MAENSKIVEGKIVQFEEVCLKPDELGALSEKTLIHPEPILGKYILMPQTDTYASGVLALQKACVVENNPNQPKIVLPNGRTVYRANTFLKNIIARMNDWEILRDENGNERALDDRKRYIGTWLDSCCGVAYQAKSTKLKLQLICPQLTGIAEDFNKDFLPVDYASFQGRELDSSSKNFGRDVWMAVLEERNDVYTDYLKMLKAIAKRKIIYGFLTRSEENLETDELRAVYVNDLYYISDASGSSNLSNFARFLRHSP